MTRVGWIVLVAIVLVGAAFLSMVRIGSAPEPAQEQVSAAVAAPEQPGLAVPVAGVPRAALADSWGDPREGGARGHHGIDIPAPARTPVIAAAAGTVEKLFESGRGGTTLYVRSADGRWRHYYAHLAGYAAGMREGLRVRQGDPLGFVGDTGDAAPGSYHLHFSVSRVVPGRGWWQGEEVNPYPLLASGRRPG